MLKNIIEDPKELSYKEKCLLIFTTFEIKALNFKKQKYTSMHSISHHGDVNITHRVVSGKFHITLERE